MVSKKVNKAIRRGHWLTVVQILVSTLISLVFLVVIISIQSGTTLDLLPDLVKFFRW